MEKFSLKWNDFEANASKSFRKLRMEENFFDVTLVSDDEQIVSAHKLVLSASSQFFKNLLKKSTHSNPLVYLPGVKSADLNFIIDYIYYGEVQLEQDNLDNFLNVAQKLKLEGLTEGQKKKNICKRNIVKMKLRQHFTQQKLNLLNPTFLLKMIVQNIEEQDMMSMRNLCHWSIRIILRKS